MRKVLIAFALVAWVAAAAWAEGQSPEGAEPQPGATVGIPGLDEVLGQWEGLKEDLAKGGVEVHIGITQVIQQNAYGGRSTNDGLRYSGSADLTVTFDTAKLGLWKGGQLLLNAEPKWGDGANRKVGALFPVNMDAIKPGFGEGCMMTLSEWIYQQVLLDGKLILIGGKLDGSRAFDRNIFANDERTQFLNLALRNNVLIGPFLPYTDIGVGFILRPAEWITLTAAVADSEGRAKTTGFETTFHGPTHTTSINEMALHLKPFGKPGNYRFGFVWSSKEFPHLQPPSPFKETGPLMMKLLGPKLAKKVVGIIAPPNTSPDNVAVYFNFDQWIYQEEADPSQGIGIFGRFGWGRSDVNAVEYFYSCGIGGKGILPGRDADTFGLGYYYADLSDEMPSMFHKEAGVELFYNIEVTPNCHVTPDFQVIFNPGGTNDEDLALVWGVRLQIDL